MADFISTVLSNDRSFGSQYPSGAQAFNAVEQARRLILDHGHDAVIKDLQQFLQQLSPHTCKALKTILFATRNTSISTSTAAADSAACSRLRSALTAELPTWIQQMPTDEQQLASDLVAVFLPELESLPATALLQLLDTCTTAFVENKQHCCILMELIPQCLAAIAVAASTAGACASNAAAEATGDAAGDEPAAQDNTQGRDEVTVDAECQRNTVITRILNSKNWQPEQLGQILQVLKNIHMTKEQVEKAIKKTVNVCRAASLQQLPPVLYQLLLLAAGHNARSTALDWLTKLFKHLESQPGHQAAAVGDAEPLPSRTLLQVEATMLMHISTLLKYDAVLGSEWLKWMKLHLVPNQFLLQVAFTMSRHHKLEQPMQQLLKKAVQQACEDEALEGGGTTSRWLAHIRGSGRGPTLKDLQAGLMKAVRCSVEATELVCPGLLQLAANLLATPCSSPLHIVMAARQGTDGSLPPQASAGARAVRLGLILLQEVFQAHEKAQGEVLKVCQVQLSGSNLDTALPHVLLLSSICRDQPGMLNSHIAQLKECLSSFAGLSADAALVLLLALWPLCRVRSDLQDHVIMLLRKMMYRQDVGGRLVAIRGFLCLILQTLADAPGGSGLGGSDPSIAGCSQASLSQMSSLSGSGGVNLLQELSVVLRRALGQQAPVREALYKGLLQVLTADPCSHELLCELLLPHLRSYMHEDDQQLPPLQLQRCAAVVQGEATLIEPLPVLLSCVHRLAAEFPAAASGDWNTGNADNSSTALQGCFNTIRTQLGRCELEHLELGGPADLNPLTTDGLLSQLHAANLLGVLEVVIEDVVMETQQLQQENDNKLDAGQVTRLGEELSKLFALHSQVYNLALEGGKSGGKKGKKKGQGTAADDGAAQQATAGQKRGRPSTSFTPVHKLVPQMSADCLALLCNAVVDDGLLQLPDDADVTLVNHHAQLSRDAGFRSFVLRSCANLLESAQSAAASAALQDLEAKGTAAAAPAAAEVLQLGPVLFRVAKLIMHTATPGGRSSGPSRSGSGTSGGPADKSDAHSDSLEQLSANALLQLLKLAEATQQLAALFQKLPGTAANGTEQQKQQEQQVGIAPVNIVDTSAAIAAEVVPNLQHIEQCVDALMRNSCFKEAQTAAECLMLLGKHLGYVQPKADAEAAAAAAGAQQQQQGVAAHVEVSKWAEGALQQDEPEVKSVGLAKILLEMYTRFAPNDIAALKTTVTEIQSLVGDTEQDQTQATQLHGTVLPLLTGTKTAQPCAAAPMAYIEESFGQIERLIAGNLKAGVVQDGDSESVAKERAQLAKEICKRMHSLLQCMVVLVNTIFGMPAIVDQQVKVLTRAYKLLSIIAKAYQLPKAAVAAGKSLSKEFEDLVSMVHKDLTHRVYHFLTDEQEAQRNLPRVNINRIKREAKMIPTLIFNMEDWEKQLVATGRAVSKNLLKDARRATCRDFKINNPELKAAAAAAAAAAAGGSGGAAAAGGSGGSRPASRQQSAQPSGDDAAEGEVEMQDAEQEEEEVAETDDGEDPDAENQEPAGAGQGASMGAGSSKQASFGSAAAARSRAPLHSR